MKINSRHLQSTVLLTLCLMVLLLGGCRGRGGQETPEEVAVTAIPTATAVPAIPTFTPTNVPDTPTPVPTHTPIPPPTAVPTVEDKRATVNSQYGANLRAGPGRAYAAIGVLEQGAKVTAIAQTRDRQWIQLENGWVFHNLLDGIPANLPLPRSIPSPPTPTPLPPTATATPAPSTPTLVPTPTPRLGDFEDPFHYNEEPNDPFEDGLSIKLTQAIYGDDDAISNYMERPIGQDCRDCLALVLEIRNVDGHKNEYVAQSDFRLVRESQTVNPGPPRKYQSDPTVRQETCTSSQKLQDGRNLKHANHIPQQALGNITVHLCFTGIDEEVSRLEIVRAYRLAYAHIYIAPSPPTPTPESRSSDGTVISVENEEERKEWKWIRYFKLG